MTYALFKIWLINQNLIKGFSMKKRIITLLLLVGLVHSSSAQIFPDFTATDIEGNEHTLYSYLDEGKFVLIKFLASY